MVHANGNTVATEVIPSSALRSDLCLIVHVLRTHKYPVIRLREAQRLLPLNLICLLTASDPVTFDIPTWVARVRNHLFSFLGQKPDEVIAAVWQECLELKTKIKRQIKM